MKSILLKNTKKTPLKTVIFLILATVTLTVIVFFYDQISLSNIQSNAKDIQTYIKDNYTYSIIIAMAIYFFCCALPMPFVSIITIAIGYFFGLVQGLLIVSFMSALGGTLLFLMTRYIFRDWAREKKHILFPRLQKATNTQSFAVALSIRFIPGMPFSFPAIALALSQLSIVKFYLSTQLGLLIILFVYINAGKNLTTIHHLNDIFTPLFILSMLLLALVPIALSWYGHTKKITIPS